MASNKTKSGEVSGADKSSSKEKATRSVAKTATDLIGDVERTAEALAKEVKQLFDNLSEKVAATASAAAETTASVADKVVAKDPSQLIRGLLGEVKAAGETSLTVISERFNALRRQLHSPANTEGKPANGASKKAIEPNKGMEGAQQEAPAQPEKAVMRSGDATTSSAKRRANTKKVARKKAVVAKKAAQKKQVEAKAKSEAGTPKVGKKIPARAPVAKKTSGKKTSGKKIPVTKAPIKKKVVPGGEQSGGDV